MQLLETLHPEDVKAAIRKRFGTVKEFTRQKGLGPTAVSDLFRGYTSKRTADAVEEFLQEELSETISDEHSEADGRAHRLSGAAR